MRRAKLNIVSSIFKGLLCATILAVLIGFLFGYRLILVNGWSAEPYIPYRSIILTSPTKLENLKVGDFITYSNNNSFFNFRNQSNVTHQIVAIKYDGYFVEGEDITLTIDGVEYDLQYGQAIKKVDDQGNITFAKETEISKTCNIITMQRQKMESDPNKADITAQKEYKNFEQVVGRVVGYNKPIGQTLFLLLENKAILFGFIGCFVLLLIISNQFSSKNIRQYK